MPTNVRFKIAVIGTGISGLSAAWLLSRRHDVTIYEQANRVGGHSNTIFVQTGAQSIPVDTGFIVFNRATYPNFTALLKHLGVPTQASNMSFGVSLEGGDLEYAGGDLAGLLAQPRNLLRRRFWSMLGDIRRFYREAARDAEAEGFENLSLGDYLARGGYGAAFCEDHLLPMASAIWSASPSDMLGYPMASFIRFHANHGLLQIANRPIWETVSGGAVAYVRALIRPLAGRIRLNTPVAGVRRRADEVMVFDRNGGAEAFDHVILATHANQALSALIDPSPEERALLGAIKYSRNHAVLHSDTSLMPKRRAAWASWNYIGPRTAPREEACFTYWMNSLQNISNKTPLFVTLNPPRAPRQGTLHHAETYDHPIFDLTAIAAQKKLWQLQGLRRTWFCGAHFGYGFHEDGLQAGLAVAEHLGGVRRPWSVAHESGRITLPHTLPGEHMRDSTA
jgi:predicted NAD/FAD-binding protein